MAIKTIETLKSYFFDHAYPTWRQFHDVLDSFRHKDDKLAITDVDGLADQLNGRVTDTQLDQEIQDRKAGDASLHADIDGKASASELAAEVQARTNADNNLSQVVSELTSALTIVQNWKSAMTDADSDSIINTLTELLNLAKNVPEGADLAALLAQKVNTTDIVDNLTSVLINVPLSAYQGNVLKGFVDTLQNIVSTHTGNTDIHITISERIAWNAATVIQGTSFILVKGNDTAANNASALQAAYTAAKSKTPFGIALSATNRYTILIGAGTYTFGSIFTIDTQYIDIVSISGNPDVYVNGVSITANDVYVKGINCGTNLITIATGLANLKMENSIAMGDKSFNISSGSVISGVFKNCTGGNYSFGSTASGTFINCTGGNYSFGSTASGTFINCTGGNYSFGSTIASGIFTNCKGGSWSFGSTAASGTFTNCVSGDMSFGPSTASGTFRYCIGGGWSFGGNAGSASGTFYYCVSTGDISFGGTASGTFINCISGYSSFGYNSASGIFRNCTAGTYSFGGNTGTTSGTFTNCTGGDNSFCGKATGIFTNCTAGDNSFGSSNLPTGGAFGTFTNCIAGNSSFGILNINPMIVGAATGVFTNCKAGNSSFGGYNASPSATSYTGVASGTFKNCIAGTYSFGGSFNSSYVPGICSGTFIDCTGGLGSFGSTIASTALLYNCYLTSGTFQSPLAGGLIRNCLDGTKTLINN